MPGNLQFLAGNIAINEDENRKSNKNRYPRYFNLFIYSSDHILLYFGGFLH